MSLNIKEKDGITVVVIDEAINITNKKLVKDSILKLIENGSKKIIIDLNNLKTLSSIALGLFTYLQKTIKEKNGGEIKITSLSAHNKDLFKITKLDEIFEVCDSVEDAIKKYKIRIER